MWWSSPLYGDEDPVIDRDPLAATEAAYRESMSPEDGELSSLRKQIAEAHQRLAKENRHLLQQQSQHERKDPIAKGLREDLIQAEKLVREIRASLKSRLEAIEEIRTIELRRRELIREVELLKERERALLKRLPPKQAG